MLQKVKGSKHLTRSEVVRISALFDQHLRDTDQTDSNGKTIVIYDRGWSDQRIHEELNLTGSHQRVGHLRQELRGILFSMDGKNKPREEQVVGQARMSKAEERILLLEERLGELAMALGHTFSK